MSTDRRIEERHSRRLDVRFWRRGSSQAHAGFTTNVSSTGLFLGTTQSLEPGERLRLELVDRSAGFVVEGEVARVHRVSIALRHVDQPGAGVRFLRPEELVGALVPAARASRAPRPAGAAPPADTTRYAPGTGPGKGAQVNAAPLFNELSGATSDPVPPAVPAVTPSRTQGTAAGTDERRPERKTPTPRPAAQLEPVVVPVEFPDRSSFLSVYHRDLSAGTLFISTDVPASLNDTVVVELLCPPPSSATLRFPAKVVRRFEPEAAVGGGRNVLAGMGVRFLEPDSVRAQLAPVLAELRR